MPLAEVPSLRGGGIVVPRASLKATACALPDADEADEGSTLLNNLHYLTANLDIYA